MRGPPRSVVEQQPRDNEAEEGEVNSDGGEVMTTVEAVVGSGSRMDLDWEASSVTVGREASIALPREVDHGRSVALGWEVARSSVTVGRDEEEDEEIPDGPGEERLRGGLVDYGSSDESD
jgi:hypothetical protein